MRSILFSLLLPLLLFANDVERSFQQAGLISIDKIDSTIDVRLVNSNKSANIFRKDFYSGLEKAYLRKEVALKLKKAQVLLKKKYPDYSLCILDAARPHWVSKAMYEQLKDTEFKKFVANPKRGSMHNYGIAVDVTIIHDDTLLDMGPTPFFKSRSEIKGMYKRQQKGEKPTKEQLKNRKLLSSIMLRAGFYPLSFEWWHFNGLKKEVARKRYKMIK